MADNYRQLQDDVTDRLGADNFTQVYAEFGGMSVEQIETALYNMGICHYGAGSELACDIYAACNPMPVRELEV